MTVDPECVLPRSATWTPTSKRGEVVKDTGVVTDANWPRAGDYIVPIGRWESGTADLAILGVPTHSTSITPTGADATPAAIREALAHYSTYAGSRDLDVDEIAIVDLGDVEEPDGLDGEDRVSATVASALENSRLLVILGGDNSLTYAAMRGACGGVLADCGLVTVDAHHDLRDGETNGSPIRRLIDDGLPGGSIAQIGIADFSNSAAYAERARENGIHIVYRDHIEAGRLPELVDHALGIVGADGRDVYVDLDVDVCDRAEVPGCPAAAPGGLSANELRRLAYLFARDPRVRVIDITEIDAGRDTTDGRTVRLGALLVLEAAIGLVDRPEPEPERAR